VIFDDVSSDATWQILTEFARNALVPVRLHRQSENRGVTGNTEDALRACTGSIVVLADQDDVWYVDKLSVVEKAFRDPALMVWFSDAELIDEGGEHLGMSAWRAVHFDDASQRSIDSRSGLRLLLHGTTVTGATMAVRREVVDIALPLPEEFDGPEYLFLHDGWLAVLGSVRGRVVAEREKLTLYRRHAGQVTARAIEDSQAPIERASRSMRVAQLPLDRARTALVAQRVRERKAHQTFRQDMVEELFALDEFLRIRTLPRRSRGRRGAIVRQYVGGHYSRYARGIRTAVADLVLTGPR
jgi:hypothetical protein